MSRASLIFHHLSQPEMIPVVPIEIAVMFGFRDKEPGCMQVISDLDLERVEYELETHRAVPVLILGGDIGHLCDLAQCTILHASLSEGYFWLATMSSTGARGRGDCRQQKECPVSPSSAANRCSWIERGLICQTVA